MARQPETGPSLSRTIRRMQREQVRQRGSSSWAESGASVTPGQVVVDGTLLVHGDTRIEGTLSSPNGIVDNAALSSPVVPGAAHDDAQGFALTTAYSWLLSVDVPVPAGFTSALVTVALTASAKNTTTATDYVYASTAAAGVAPGGWVVGSGAVPAGQYGVGLDLRTFVLSGLAGSFLIEGALFTAYGAWAADGSNVANIDASILFLR